MGGIGRLGFLRRTGRLVILAVGLLVVVPVQGDTPLALHFSPELAREGQTFEVFFLLPDEGGEDLEVKTPPSLAPNASLLSGPSFFPVSEKDRETGRVGRFIKVVFRFRALRAGRQFLEPWEFSLDGEDRKTDSAVLEIARRTGSPLVPFDLAWRLPQTEVFQGQTVPVLLDMINLPLIVVPESVQVSPPGGGVFEDAEGLGGIASRSAGGKELFQLTAASYLLTPSSPGNLILRPAKVRALGMTIESPRQVLSVKALPPEARSTGAVGNFRISSWLDTPEVLLGDRLSLFIKVEGEGNLNYLQLPPMDFPDFTILETSQKSSLRPNSRGYSGWVEWEFRLSPKTAGDLKLPLPSFPWVDSETAEVRSALEKNYGIMVRKTATEEQSEILFPVLRSGEVSLKEPMDIYRRGYSYLLFLPGLGLLVYRLFRKRRGALPILLSLLFAPGLFLGTIQEIPEEALILLDQGADAYDKGNYPKAEEFFSQALEKIPRSPGLHYNLGITYGALEDFPRSIFFLRRALLARPGQTLFREALLDFEEGQGLFRQFPPLRIHPDIFFIILVVTGNLALAAPWGIKKQGTGIIVAGVFFFLASLSLTGLLYFGAERGVSWGVVDSPGAELRKIPLSSSSQWLSLPPGLTVRLRGSSGDYLLVRTGFGVEGWLEKDQILDCEEPCNGK